MPSPLNVGSGNDGEGGNGGGEGGSGGVAGGDGFDGGVAGGDGGSGSSGGGDADVQSGIVPEPQIGSQTILFFPAINRLPSSGMMSM